MKKISTIFKETSAKRIKDSIQNSQAFFIVKYSKLSGADFNNLRKSLKSSGSNLFVVRNNIAKRVLKDLGTDKLTALVEGSCGFVFSQSDPVETSKILYSFAKDKPTLIIEGGLLKDRQFSKSDFETLAKLPSRQVLIGQSVQLMKAPINKLVLVLKGTLRALVTCLDQIKSKKQ
ncbi:MAG: 50S ribosomal protein L10 [Candidatus Omnitrophica bacterium]|nr:50S ribosomal protein L10 [Candidatus Omnitrophota bacterium]